MKNSASKGSNLSDYPEPNTPKDLIDGKHFFSFSYEIILYSIDNFSKFDLVVSLREPYWAPQKTVFELWLTPDPLSPEYKSMQEVVKSYFVFDNIHLSLDLNNES